jgi:hypothetical protein
MKNKAPLFPQQCFLLLLLVSVLLSSCTDEVETNITYTVQEPVYMLRADLKEAIKVTAPQGMQTPGKIYVKGNYLFINEVDKGIHIINNEDPAEPDFISFIDIPGNLDMAVKNDILYADSYIDLVAMDISNPLDVKLVKRVENVFPTYGMIVDDSSKIFIAGFKEKTITESIENYNSRHTWGWGFLDDASFASRQSASPMAGGSGAGKGGSMARFTVVNNFLYTVSLSDLHVFDISNADDPQEGNKISLGWNIETIFPYNNKLFIGSTTGMHIYDNSNPNKPEHLSTYAHVNSCDPVVVEGDLAWVTLRSGNDCAGFTNQLEVIDVSNARSPQLLKVYPMQNPHGLGIDRSNLFLCEGAFGLKIFNIEDHMKIDENLLAHFKDHDAYDVIPLGSSLLLIGKDGLYQYDYSNPREIKLLSKIPIDNKAI